IEAGKMEIVEVEYSPREILDNITKLIRPRIGEKPIELKAHFSPDLPAVLYGDMGKVREVITNLLTNAVKYTEKGIIDFEVSCINEKGISKLVISVEDTGRGIKPEKIDKLFTKFQRLEEDRNTTLEGTGLGLAITKNLVEMMGGKIVVQSKYGSGSKFTVYLKQKIVKMESEKVEVQDKENTELVDYSDKKILVVDDNMLNIKVATRLLKNYKIVPDTVLSGEECIEKLKEKKYDLILMDDMMPKLSGGETLKKLKEDIHFDIPVVVLTANAISGMREKYLSAGFTDYLAKPIDKLELDRVLKENLHKR
ncbi:MAG: ATP-binding protein, partial [Erysipelotrichaceae bacterium]|nr:ATP-binding protein [Erysipelotrichaceae bacterium]